MCGICGIYNSDEKKLIDRAVLSRMNDKLKHRGPDGEGYFFDKNIGFAHRRLIIIDPDKGEQPMSNEDNTLWITYNGEIYNFLELREFLIKKGHVFKTKSDTEVILHFYEEEGEKCLSRFRGMFAFAIWDKRKKKLFIARDRIGKKPLYYFQKNGYFVFASEIKSLLENPLYKKEPNLKGIGSIFAYDWWIPWPETAFKGIYKMEPATYFVLENGKFCSRKYWVPDFTNKIKGRSENQIAEELYGLIDESIRIRTRSDVPLGAMLSGGVDSSGVVAFLKDYLKEVKTFTLGFTENGKVDAEFIRAGKIAREFETDHYEVLFGPADFYGNLKQLIKNHDEPYICMSGIYTWFLTRFVKEKGVTVLLSGNGADELFWGYSGGSNLKMRDIVNRVSGSFPPGFWTILAYFFFFNSKIKSQVKGLGKNFGEKTALGIDKNFFKNTEGLFSEQWALLNEAYGDIARKYYEEIKAVDFIDNYIYVALMLTYSYGLSLQPDLDGMANAVEIRSPFLDHKLIEFSAKLPVNYKIKGFSSARTGKYIFKKALEKKLPDSILYSRKLNFGMNIKWENWLRNIYGKDVRDIIASGWFVKNGLWKKDYIEKLFEQESHADSNNMQILRLLNTEIWYRIYFENEN